MDIFPLIPARGGSKGIPRKNIRSLAGRPLIEHTIEVARTAFDVPVYVSTDDEDIADVAREAGADVPFSRPAELATDEAGSVEVALHAVEHVFPDVADEQRPSICLLQPTSPLREAGDIRTAVEKHVQTADPVVSVVEHDVPPSWLYRRDENGCLERRFSGQKASRRQDSECLYRPNGAIYLVGSDTLRTRESFLPPGARPVEMPPERSVDIDDELDWLLAEAILKRRSKTEQSLDPFDFGSHIDHD